MVVRRKSVPLKRSRIVGAPPICFSISTVRSIMANVFAEFCPDLPPRRSMERRASSLRPRRISHHGDSGAIKIRIKRGVYSKSVLVSAKSGIRVSRGKSTEVQEVLSMPTDHHVYYSQG